KRKRQINEWAKTFNFDWPEQTEVTTRLRDILESDVDEKYYLDEEKTAKLVVELEEQKAVMGGGHQEPKIAVEQFTKGGGISCCIDANYTKGIAPGNVGKGRRTHVVEEVRPVLTPDRVEKRQNRRRFKEDVEEMFTLTAQDRHGIAIREATKKGYAIAEEG